MLYHTELVSSENLCLMRQQQPASIIKARQRPTRRIVRGKCLETMFVSKKILLNTHEKKLVKRRDYLTSLEGQ